MFGQSGMGSLQAPFHMYFSGLDSMAKGMGPMKGMARAQLEMMGLMSRRAQAYMEFPSRLSRCRSPQDLMQEQMVFWQTAVQQYQESSQKIMAAWSQSLTNSMPPASSLAPSFATPSTRCERDYIAFPEGPCRANGSAEPRSAKAREVA